MIDALDFFFQAGEENLEPEDFAQFDRLVTDLEQIEAFTEWSCFGEGDFEQNTAPTTTAAPVVTLPTQSEHLTADESAYCLFFAGLIQIMQPLEEDPEAGIEALLEWLEVAVAISPESLRPDLVVIRDWYVGAVETVPAKELFYNEIDYMSRDIADANGRIGEWSNANCTI